MLQWLEVVKRSSSSSHSPKTFVEVVTKIFLKCWCGVVGCTLPEGSWDRLLLPHLLYSLRIKVVDDGWMGGTKQATFKKIPLILR